MAKRSPGRLARCLWRPRYLVVAHTSTWALQPPAHNVLRFRIAACAFPHESLVVLTHTKHPTCQYFWPPHAARFRKLVSARRIITASREPDFARSAQHDRFCKARPYLLLLASTRQKQSTSVNTAADLVDSAYNLHGIAPHIALRFGLTVSHLPSKYLNAAAVSVLLH